MANYGLLARQGRREDNALMGGQVAHISAAEAEMLRRMCGAGTINPVTGLPQYYSMTAAYGSGGKSFSGPGTGTYGGPGPAANAAGSQGALNAKLFNFNLSPDGPTPVTGDMMAHMQVAAIKASPGPPFALAVACM